MKMSHGCKSGGDQSERSDYNKHTLVLYVWIRTSRQRNSNNNNNNKHTVNTHNGYSKNARNDPRPAHMYIDLPPVSLKSMRFQTRFMGIFQFGARGATAPNKAYKWEHVWVGVRVCVCVGKRYRVWLRLRVSSSMENKTINIHYG